MCFFIYLLQEEIPSLICSFKMEKLVKRKKNDLMKKFDEFQIFEN